MSPQQIILNFRNSRQERPECSICYQPINKMAIVCSSPCDKLFHASCLEKIFEQEQEKQAEEVEETTRFYSEHRCCYCRRYINVNAYILKKFAHELIALKNSRCYYVDEAFEQVLHNLKKEYNIVEFKHSGKKSDEEQGQETLYEIYELVCTSRIKTPKQSKHAEFKRTRIPRKNLIVHRNNHGKR